MIEEKPDNKDKTRDQFFHFYFMITTKYVLYLKYFVSEKYNIGDTAYVFLAHC